WSLNFSPSGRQVLMIDASRSVVELRRADGELLARRPVPETVSGVDAVLDGRVVVFDNAIGQFTLRDLERDQDFWSVPCRTCIAQSYSKTTRIAFVNFGGLEVWDGAASRLLFAETARWSGAVSTAVALSPDGRRLAWNQGATVHLRELD